MDQEVNRDFGLTCWLDFRKECPADCLYRKSRFRHEIDLKTLQVTEGASRTIRAALASNPSDKLTREMIKGDVNLNGYYTDITECSYYDEVMRFLNLS